MGANNNSVGWLHQMNYNPMAHLYATAHLPGFGLGLNYPFAHGQPAGFPFGHPMQFNAAQYGAPGDRPIRGAMDEQGFVIQEPHVKRDIRRNKAGAMAQPVVASLSTNNPQAIVVIDSDAEDVTSKAKHPMKSEVKAEDERVKLKIPAKVKKERAGFGTRIAKVVKNAYRSVIKSKKAKERSRRIHSEKSAKMTNEAKALASSNNKLLAERASSQQAVYGFRFSCDSC